jgi:GT2 family glycosyltransferase
VKATAIVLAYGDEPWLGDCLTALADEGVDIVIVDNGSTRPELVAEWQQRPDVTLVRPGSNLGFAGGCNLGAAAASGDVLMFVNSDAIVQPGTVAALTSALSREDTGLVCGSIRFADAPELLNTTGNPFHYVGVVWSGHFGEPASEHSLPVDVATVTGATFAVRRSVWEALGGFADEWFAYHEDSELSLRAWQRGWRVRYEPAAVVHHHYEFSRHPRKSYLLERNRLLNLLTLYQLRTLIVLTPMLTLFELLMIALSIRQGWLPEKVRGYRWILCNGGYVARRRRSVQSARVRPDRELAPMWAGRLVLASIENPPGLRAVNAVLEGYWRLARPLL